MLRNTESLDLSGQEVMFITDNDVKSRLNSTRDLFGEIAPEIESDQALPESRPEVINIEQVEGNQEQESPNLVVVPHQFRGRHAKVPNIPDFLRPIIGASSLIAGRGVTAEAFGVSEASVTNYSQGRVGERPEPEMKSKVDIILGKAQETAADRLMSALGFITDEKLENAKVGDLSKIAADMSRVIEKTTEKKAFVGAQIVIYAPQLKSEDKFEIIES